MKFTKQIKRFAVSAAALSLTLVMAAGAAQTGTVTENLRLRAEPSTTAAVLTVAPQGASISLLSEEIGGWYQVSYGGLNGYMSAEYIAMVSAETANKIPDQNIPMGDTMDQLDEQAYIRVNTEGATLNVRSGAGTGFAVLGSLYHGSILPVTGDSDGWYQVDFQGGAGFVSGDYVEIVTIPAMAAGEAGAGSQIVLMAQNYLGCPYVYGAAGPASFDCSGFTSYIYQQCGYTLNRTATDQLANGVSVEKSALQPGDLVFFKYNTTKPVSHVGIYVGDGQFIHASTNNYKVRFDDLTTGHYANVYVGARRVVNF